MQYNQGDPSPIPKKPACHAKLNAMRHYLILLMAKDLGFHI
jgi:hypothetical protein